jgi:hypothetical protein
MRNLENRPFRFGTTRTYTHAQIEVLAAESIQKSEEYSQRRSQHTRISVLPLIVGCYSVGITSPLSTKLTSLKYRSSVHRSLAEPCENAI